jgi:hypothetical protein
MINLPICIICEKVMAKDETGLYSCFNGCLKGWPCCPKCKSANVVATATSFKGDEYIFVGCRTCSTDYKDKCIACRNYTNLDKTDGICSHCGYDNVDEENN